LNINSFVAAFHSPYLHFTLVATAYLLFVTYFFIGRLKSMFSQLRRKWNPPAPYQPQLLIYYKNASIFWFFVVLTGLVLFLFAIYLSRYQYVGDKVYPAGQATLHRNNVSFVSHNGVSNTYAVRGGEVAAGGIFLRFSPWMRILGLETYHRLITFRGNQENVYHYSKPTAVWLESYADWLYVFFYKNKKWFPFADPFYTESPYFAGGKRRLLVTHSGYIIQ